MPTAILASFSRTRPKSAITLPNALLLGVSYGILERQACPTHTHGAQLEAANVQDVEGDDVPLANFAEHVFGRNFAVVQNDGAGRRSADAHLVLFRADGKSGEGFLDQERREFFAINFGKDGKQIREAGVGDPHLLAVENVMLAVFRKLSAGAAVERIRTGRSFRESISADNFS